MFDNGYEVVLDLEFTATPQDVAQRGLRSEVIELGAVKVGGSGQVIDRFQSFVRPEHVTNVSNRVRRLTGIMRRDYLAAEGFAKVLGEFAKWAGCCCRQVVTWSGSDKRQIETECAFKGVEVPTCFESWADAQQLYAARVMQAPNKQPKLSVAATWLGVECEGGKAHRALYDAQVTAQVLCMVESGEYKRQQEALGEVVRKPEERTSLSASIGSMCGDLLRLRELLVA